MLHKTIKFFKTSVNSTQNIATQHAKESKRAQSYKTCKVYFGQSARQELLEGIKLVNKATQVTLGPKGRNVAIEYEVGMPRITKDGVTVARNVMFKDRFKEIGASMIRQASGNTNIFAGDGTTTSTLITCSIIEEGQKYLRFNVNPIEMKRGMEKAKTAILEFLEEIKEEVDVKNKQQLEKLAAVSTNYDPLLSKIIADTLEEVGFDGNVEIEPGNQLGTQVFFTNGVCLARPYASIDFVLDKASGQLDLDYPLVLVVNNEIKTIKEITPVINIAKKMKKQLFIAALDISPEVMSHLIYNHRNHIVEMCAITVPGMGDFSRIVLEDLATITGSTLGDKSLQQPIDKFTIDDLGKARKILCSSQDTYIQGGESKQEELQKRMALIRKELSAVPNENKKKILKDRLGRLSGKMAVVQLGGLNDLELMETRDRLVDALNTVKMGMKEGILPGGGTALLRASQVLDFVEGSNYDQQCGIDILKKVLKLPIKQLHSNYNQNGSIIIDKLLNQYNENVNFGFDLNQEKYVDMIEAGIIDSFSIVKSGIIDGISIGSMVLTTEAVLVKDKVYIAPKVNTYKKDIF